MSGDRKPPRGLDAVSGDREPPSVLSMMGIVALIVAVVILVFFAVGYVFGRLFL